MARAGFFANVVMVLAQSRPTKNLYPLGLILNPSNQPRSLFSGLTGRV